MSDKSINWDEFELHFQQIHTNFYKKLLKVHPQLSINERRLCAFISLNLSNKEISELTLKSTRSIEVAKYRIKIKLGLTAKQSIAGYLNQYL